MNAEQGKEENFPEELEFIENKQQVLWKAEAEQAQSGILSWRMLENNEIKGLLPFDYYYVDNRIHFYYACQSLQKLEDYFKKKEGDFDTLYFICMESIKIILRGQEYLLGQGGYLLTPEWIFWSRREKKLALCYLPGGKRELDKDYVKLVEFLMQHTNHKDKKAVEMIYQLYDMLLTEGFVPEQLQKYLEEIQKSGSQIQEEIGRKRTKDKQIKESDEKRTINEDVGLNNEEKDFQYFLKPIATEKNSDLQKRILFTVKEAVLPISLKETVVGRKIEDRLDSSLYNGQDADSSVINLPLQVISRRHALFLYEMGQLFIMDTESKNGTYLNGNKISAYVKTHCKAGDVITFADISFQILHKSSTD